LEFTQDAPFETVRPAEPSDRALLDRLPGDPSALATLYDRYGRLVYGIALRSLGNVDDANDLTQEIFVGLHHQNNFDPSRGTLAAYLVTLTRTRAIDQLRFGSRKVRLLRTWWEWTPVGEPQAAPVDLLSLEECATRVRTALDGLSEQERQVIELAYYKGLSHAEIAETLGAPLGSVKSWARRGLLRLRQALGDLLE
jgi:RNA polymerase sigma-70 factor (ECF subfamily)